MGGGIVRVYVRDEWTTVGEAPVGLLLLRDGALLCKTEYTHPETEADPMKRRCTVFIVASGEYYCGEGDAARCRPVLVAE